MKRLIVTFTLMVLLTSCKNQYEPVPIWYNSNYICTYKLREQMLKKYGNSFTIKYMLGTVSTVWSYTDTSVVIRRLSNDTIYETSIQPRHFQLDTITYSFVRNIRRHVSCKKLIIGWKTVDLNFDFKLDRKHYEKKHPWDLKIGRRRAEGFASFDEELLFRTTYDNPFLDTLLYDIKHYNLWQWPNDPISEE